ncbi:MAG TPA: ABC transporter ATP-binding protein [Gaiellaceae bacterium]
MRAIVGVQVVAGGEVEVLGAPAGTPAVRSRVGYLTQEPSVYLDLTVHENLRFFAQVLDAPRGRIGEVLATVGLEEYADRQVRRLSGGQLSRVSLATALLGAPEVLVLDEPTVGLDPVLRRDLWDAFQALAEGGATLLVSSHVMDEAARCHDIVLLREGEIIAAESPASLLARTGAPDMDAAFLALVEGS